jgi:hypothetical protein
VEGIGPVETFLKGNVAGVLLVDFGLLGGGHVGVVDCGRLDRWQGRLDRWWKGRGRVWVVKNEKYVNNTTVLKMGSVEGVDNCFYARLLWSTVYQHSNDLFIF